jgi:hypothetical protein
VRVSPWSAVLSRRRTSFGVDLSRAYLMTGAIVCFSRTCHWHGVILHPDQSRSELADVLDLHFPEDRQAYLEENWHKRQLMENLDRVLDYALVADRHVPTLKGKPIVDADTAGLIARRIVLLQYMCQRGIQGIRLKLNMKSQNYWKSDVLHDRSGNEIEIPMDFRRIVLGRKVRGGNRGDLL